MAGVNVGTAYLEIIPSAKGFAGKLQSEVGGGMAKAGKDAGDRAGKSFGGSFGTSVKSLLGAGAALALGGGVIDFFKSANEEARESQKVGAQTASVLKSTGGAAGVTATQIGNLATAISNKTGVDDEAIQSNENLLLTFTNVRNEVGKGNDIFNQATQTVSDMSAALKQDGKSSAIQLGKALNDPVKGITALSRVGVSFTEQQKKQIKGLVAHNKSLAAQKIILGELKKEFGGSAAATATSGEKMSVAFSNLKESIGTALLPVIDKLENFLTSKIIPAVSSFISGIQSGTGPGGQFADVIGKVKDAFEQVAPLVGKVIGFLVDNKAAVAAFAGVILTVVAAVKVWTAVQTALDIALNANPIGLIVVAIAALVAGVVYAYQHFTTFRNIVNTTFSVLKTVVGAVVGFIKDHWALLLPILLGPFGLFVVLVIKNFDKVKSAVETVFHAIGAAGKWLWNNALQPVIQLIINGFATLMDWIGNFLGALGHIPGFGWAKDAAANMHNAADKARELADNIDKIHDKNVTVTLNAVTIRSTQDHNAGDPRLSGARAWGGSVVKGSTYRINERGEELFTAPANGYITPHAALSGGGGGARQVNLVVGDRVFQAYMEDVADNRIGAHAAFNATTRRMR